MRSCFYCCLHARATSFTLAREGHLEIWVVEGTRRARQFSTDAYCRFRLNGQSFTVPDYHCFILTRRGSSLGRGKDWTSLIVASAALAPAFHVCDRQGAWYGRRHACTTSRSRGSRDLLPRTCLMDDCQPNAIDHNSGRETIVGGRAVFTSDACILHHAEHISARLRLPSLASRKFFDPFSVSHLTFRNLSILVSASTLQWRVVISETRREKRIRKQWQARSVSFSQHYFSPAS